MNLDRWHYILGALVILSLFAHGAREKKHVEDVQSWKTEKATLESRVTVADSKNTIMEAQIKRSVKTHTKTTPVELPSGKVAYLTEEVSETLEDEISKVQEQYDSQITELTTKNSILEAKLKTHVEDTVKNNPFWYAGVDWQPLNQGMSAYTPQVGVNVGPFTIFVGHPLELTFEPHVGAGLRF